MLNKYDFLLDKLFDTYDIVGALTLNINQQQSNNAYSNRKDPRLRHWLGWHCNQQAPQYSAILLQGWEDWGTEN